MTTPISLDPRSEMLAEAMLFLLRHVPVPNLIPAFLADLHRAAAGDAAKSRVVDEWAERLRDKDEMIADDDA